LSSLKALLLVLEFLLQILTNRPIIPTFVFRGFLDLWKQYRKYGAGWHLIPGDCKVFDASRPDVGPTKAHVETGTDGWFARGKAVISLSVLLASVYCFDWQCMELYLHSPCSL
jgi:hypothetical protein